MFSSKQKYLLYSIIIKIKLNDFIYAKHLASMQQRFTIIITWSIGRKSKGIRKLW